MTSRIPKDSALPGTPTVSPGGGGRPTKAALACRRMLREWRRVVRRKGEAAGRKYSRFRGVRWDPECLVWRVAIYHEGRRLWFGFSSTDEEAAARKYDELATEIKGEGAGLNFPGARAAAKGGDA